MNIRGAKVTSYNKFLQFKAQIASEKNEHFFTGEMGLPWNLVCPPGIGAGIRTGKNGGATYDNRHFG